MKGKTGSQKDRIALKNNVKRWAGKTVIGLTGNIGTGKSVVRLMLEHLGALGIDADAVSHGIIEKGSSGYLPVVEYFGYAILTPAGDIDRRELGKIVFSNTEALQVLEKIIHPRVSEAVDLLINCSSRPVVVIEAIKLIEGYLGRDCDSIWVVTADQQTQLNRLVVQRKMTESDALQRIQAQPPQEEKLRYADVVIDNHGTLDETWQQVKQAWQKLLPEKELCAAFQDTAIDAITKHEG